MADISLGSLRDIWKKVSDWVDGLYAPKVRPVNGAGVELFSASNPGATMETGGLLWKTLHDDLQILDTENYDAYKDLLDYPGEKSIFIKNGLDKAVTVSIFGANPGNTDEELLGSFVVLAGQYVYKWASGSGFEYLADPWPGIKLRLACAQTPSTGTVTTKLGASKQTARAPRIEAQLVGELPAGTNIIGLIKLSDGTNVLAINTDGSINLVPVNSAGTELFTDGNPGTVKLSESLPAGVNNIGNVNATLSSHYPAGAVPFIARLTSGANAIGTATVAAVADKSHYVLGYKVVIRGAAAGNDIPIQLKDGATEKLYDLIGNTAPTGTSAELVSSFPVLRGTANTDLVLSAAEGGAGVVTELTIWGYTL